MSTEDVRSAIFIPSDGYIDPASVAQALAKGAKDKGAKIVIGERATGFTVENERVTLVETDQGAWTCDLLVNACGMWGHEVGQLAGVRVPSFAVEHQYLITDPIPDAPKRMPTMRDPDHLVYYKPEVRGLVVGGYEPDTQPFAPGGIPREFAQELLPGNFDRFEQLAKLAAKRTPIINQVGVRQLLNGPIPYSADGDFVMGKAPELDNYFVCNRLPLRHRGRRRRGPHDGGVDHRWPAQPQSLAAGYPPLRLPPRHQALHVCPRGGAVWRSLQVRLPGQGARDPARHPPLAAL